MLLWAIRWLRAIIGAGHTDTNGSWSILTKDIMTLLVHKDYNCGQVTLLSLLKRFNSSLPKIQIFLSLQPGNGQWPLVFSLLLTISLFLLLASAVTGGLPLQKEDQMVTTLERLKSQIGILCNEHSLGVITNGTLWRCFITPCPMGWAQQFLVLWQPGKRAIL
jgi:hypothetical protein